ncbi:hypothetical protein CBM2599_B50434 [Cupriavidus taiwanensis]|nr:hypothetical protein CBM2600_B10557 [Cupriavidus taiwanensis]SOY96502.1 hypothetical protein CBM2599_B50434 [Cupriavidus taiwanensis]
MLPCRGKSTYDMSLATAGPQEAPIPNNFRVSSNVVCVTRCHTLDGLQNLVGPNVANSGTRHEFHGSTSNTMGSR